MIKTFGVEWDSVAKVRPDSGWRNRGDYDEGEQWKLTTEEYRPKWELTSADCPATLEAQFGVFQVTGSISDQIIKLQTAIGKLIKAHPYVTTVVFDPKDDTSVFKKDCSLEEDGIIQGGNNSPRRAYIRKHISKITGVPQLTIGLSIRNVGLLYSGVTRLMSNYGDGTHPAFLVAKAYKKTLDQLGTITGNVGPLILLLNHFLLAVERVAARKGSYTKASFLLKPRTNFYRIYKMLTPEENTEFNNWVIVATKEATKEADDEAKAQENANKKNVTSRAERAIARARAKEAPLPKRATKEALNTLLKALKNPLRGIVELNDGGRSIKVPQLGIYQQGEVTGLSSKEVSYVPNQGANAPTLQEVDGVVFPCGKEQLEFDIGEWWGAEDDVVHLEIRGLMLLDRMINHKSPSGNSFQKLTEETNMIDLVNITPVVRKVLEYFERLDNSSKFSFRRDGRRSRGSGKRNRTSRKKKGPSTKRRSGRRRYRSATRKTRNKA